MILWGLLATSLIPGLVIFLLPEDRHLTRTILNVVGAVAKVALRADPLALPPRDGALLRARFRRALLGPAADQ